MKYFLILLSLIPSIIFSQSTYTLSGTVTDSETGETLIGATVLARETNTGTITNSYGFYSLSLPEGQYSIQYSYVGYEKSEFTLALDRSQVKNIEIIPSSMELEEVIVSSEKDEKNITSVLMGIEKLDLQKTEILPVFFGEKDVLKTIQLLPGISNSAEGSTGFNVRGGSMGQNLILLDEAPVYSSSHLMGFFSVFNSDALKDVTVYKGSIPASFGSRASSVLDITMNDGNKKQFSSSGGIGIVSSRISLEGPVIRDKMSYIISGRRTYGDLFAKLLFPGDIITDDTNFYFYDVNAKLNYTINDRNRIYLSGYFGKDVFEISGNTGTNWGNTTGTFRWNHLFSDKFFSNTSFIYSRFDYGFIFGQNTLRLRSGIEDYSFAEDLTWFINPENTLKTGIDLTWHQFLPGELNVADTSGFNEIRKEKQGFEGAIYIQNEQKIGSRLSINYGLRYSGFAQAGPVVFYDYNADNEITDSTSVEKGAIAVPFHAFEPRIAVNYLLNNSSSLKLSYNRMAQYLHLLSNTTSSFPNDVWVPSSNNLKPVLVDHFSAGFFKNYKNNEFETSIEVYYKNISNISDYEDGAEILFSEYVESQILSGKGRSYGLELYLKKKYGTVSGWISYTLGRSENRIEGINAYSWYPVRYDKTHDLSIVSIFKLSKRVSLSGIWTYATGNAVTFPSGKYIVDNVAVPYYTERNGYRMPAYHRLDLSLAIDGKNRKRFKSTWDISIYNAYNRYNAYIITFRENTEITGSTEAVKLSLFGIVPTLTYKFKF